MRIGNQLRRLLDSVQNHGVRMSLDWGTKGSGNVVRGYSVVSTDAKEHGENLPLTAIVVEYDDGSYDLFLPTTSNKITADVEAVCRLPDGTGTLVD